MSQSESRVTPKLILAIFGLGVLLTLGGIAVTLAGWHRSTISPLGAVGLAMLVGGVAAFAASMALFVAAASRMVEGPRDRPDPSPASDPGPVTWVPNPSWVVLRRKEGRTRAFQYVALAAFAVVSAALGLLFSGILNPSMTLGDAIIGFWFVFMTVFSVALSLGSQRTSVFAPTRLGFSAGGLHLGFYAEALGRRKLPHWVPQYAPWTRIASLELDGSGLVRRLQMEQVGGGQWFVDGLDPSLAVRVREEWLRGSQNPVSPPINVPLATGAMDHGA